MNHRPFSLDLVSGIAARFLEGDKYEEAARRALALLKACEAEIAKADPVARMMALLGGNGADTTEVSKIEAGKRVDQLPTAADLQAKESDGKPSPVAKDTFPDVLRPTLPASVPFQRMLNHITKANGEKARSAYTDFLRWYMRAEKAKPPYCYVADDSNPDGSKRTGVEKRADEERRWFAGVAEIAEPPCRRIEARMKAEAVHDFSREEVEHLAHHFSLWRKRQTSESAANRGRQGGRGRRKI